MYIEIWMYVCTYVHTESRIFEQIRRQVNEYCGMRNVVFRMGYLQNGLIFLYAVSAKCERRNVHVAANVKK